jgi:valyl-tRNA synthetase
MGDPDVMDTWATSSMSPEFVSGWERDPDLFARVFPMDLRPQGQDIIRTWLFYTIVRAEMHFGTLPFATTNISGFVQDPERKKLSKSASNADDDPFGLIAKHGADSVRYWASGSRPGRDGTIDPNEFKIGRRLAMKVLNASKFVLGFGDVDDDAPITETVDAALLAALARVVGEATAAFENYDYTKARDAVETFFWSFCDDYLELVKTRAYGAPDEPVSAATASARRTLRAALSIQLRLFAPVLAYVTEEVWSWWQEGSVHRAPWPTAAEASDATDSSVLDTAAHVLSAIRRAKTEAKVGMKTPVKLVTFRGTAEEVAAVESARADLMAAGVVAELDAAAGDAPIAVEFAASE